MKNTKTMLALFVAIFVGFSPIVEARRMGGGGFSRSSSPSRSFGSSSSKSRSSGSGFSKPKPAPKQNVSKPKTSTKPKEHAVAPKTKTSTTSKATTAKVDTTSPKYQKTDAMIAKNIGTSGKTYSSRKEASTAMRDKMATKKYDYKDSSTAMANRPEYIPASHSVGGNTYNTVYYGGSYGYRNSLGDFVAYTAANMLITDMMLHSYTGGAYGPVAYNTAPRTVVVQERSATGAIIGAVVFVLVVGTIFVVVIKLD